MTKARSVRPERAPRRRRRWWQVVLRWGAVAAATAALLYATLPWWAPKGLLARRIAAKLASDLNMPVGIGRLEMSWQEGVTLSGVTVGGAGAAGRIVTIETLRLELAPLTMLAGRAPGWVEIDGAHLKVVVDEVGRTNIGALRPLMEGPQPGRVSVRRARATVSLPRREAPLRLGVSDLRVTAGRRAGAVRVTMSAALAQRPRPAPVTLLASTGQGRSVATCSFRFSHLDLEQLDLPEMLTLPLSRLRGAGSGSLDFGVTPEGVVEQFRCALTVRALDAQPAGGPELPVIDRAEVALEADYDWYTRALKMDRFRLRVPGVDVTGKGRIHAEALTGEWEGVRDLELTGKVNPLRVAALLSGRPRALPGGWTVDGDVGVRLSLDGSKNRLAFGAVLDASAAGLWAGRRPAKPAGRRLSLAVDGSVQRRTWRFALDRAELHLGANRFVGRGTARNIRRLLGKWSGGAEPTIEAVLADMADVDLHGSCHVEELAALGDLLAISGLDAVRLTGHIDGSWSARYADALLLRADMTMPPDAGLRIGRWFDKPIGLPLAAGFSATAPPGRPALEDVRVWASAGPAGISVEQARGSLAVADGGATAEFAAEGRYGLRDARGVLACLPALAAAAPEVRGAAAGEFRLLLAGGRRRTHLESNATQLAVRAGRAFVKAAGQPARVVVDFRADDSLPDPERNRLEVRAELGSATASGVATFGPAAGGGRALRCDGRLRVTEAAWLLERFPSLGEAMAPCDVRGAMDASVRLALDGPQWAGELRVDADDLQLDLPATGGRKPRGAALRLRASARGSGGPVALDLAADVGRSSVRCTGSVMPTGTVAPLPRGVYWPPPGVAAVDLDVRGRLTPDRTLRSLLPGAARRIARVRAEGVVAARLHVTGDAGGLAVSGALDAADLALSVKGTLNKPAGSRAHVRIEASAPPDLANVRVKDLILVTEAGQIHGSAVLPVLRDGDGDGRVALNVPDLAVLGRQWIELGRNKPAGGIFAECVFRRSAGRTVLRAVNIQADRAAGTLNRRPVRLDGSLRLEDVSLSRADPAVGRAVTESLEWAFGPSHGFLVADVRDLTRNPTGRVELLCTVLDTVDLQQALGVTAPTSRRLSDRQRAALSRRAGALADDLHVRLAKAALHGRVRAHRLKYRDDYFRADYELRGAAAELFVIRGKLRATIAAGLNGGQVEQSYRLDFDQEAPRVALDSDVRNLQAAENIQRQMDMDFPGNTVGGAFSRSEHVSFALADFLMGALDARHRPVPVGRAKTVTTDGAIRGRSAPKFIANIFPGLNLTTYRYEKMIAFAELLPSGTARNDMLFDGIGYDIYIEGDTDKDRIGRYTTGVLLLPTKTSPESLHGLKQGRIPILKFKARIEDGQFHDQQVWYPLPTETAFTIFLKNNLLFRLWTVAFQKKGAAVIAPTKTTGNGKATPAPRGP